MLSEVGRNVKVDQFEVWQENWEILQIFLRLDSQWRWLSGAVGAVRTGLDFGVVFQFIDRRFRKKKKREEVFDLICLMESAALQVICEQAAARSKQ